MSSLWSAGSRQAQGVPQMPPVPIVDETDAMWVYLETGINRIMYEPTLGSDIRSFVGLYTAVHNYCTSHQPVGWSTSGVAPLDQRHHRGAHLIGEELYRRLIECLRQYLTDLKRYSKIHSDEALLQFYLEEWDHYTKSAKYISHIFRYLNRHWIKRELDEGKKVYDIYNLYFIQWRQELQEILGDVMKAFLKLAKKHSNSEITEQSQIAAAIDSFVSLGLDDTDPLKCTFDYQVEFVQFLSGNSVIEYMKMAASSLKEDQLVNLYLHPNTKLPDINAHKITTAILKLVTNDYAVIEVKRQVAECSTLIKHILEDLGDEAVGEEPIPLPNVNEAVLRKVLEWCEHHKNDPSTTDSDNNNYRMKTTDIEEWDEKYVQVDQEMLFNIILAANYLDISPLLDVCCKTMAKMIMDKSPEEIRRTFNITNDFTPEVEEAIRRENEWAD